MEDFSNLPVVALKALCKERNLSGYSKLSKLALIDKLHGRLPASNEDIRSPTPVSSSNVIQSTINLSSSSFQLFSKSAESKRQKQSESGSKPAKKLKASTQTLKTTAWQSSADTTPPNLSVVFSADFISHNLGGATCTSRETVAAEGSNWTRCIPSSFHASFPQVSAPPNLSPGEVLPLVPRSVKATENGGSDEALVSAGHFQSKFVGPIPTYTAMAASNTRKQHGLVFRQTHNNGSSNLLLAKEGQHKNSSAYFPPSKPFQKPIPRVVPPKQKPKAIDLAMSPSITMPVNLFPYHLDFQPRPIPSTPSNISLPPRLSQRALISRLAIVLAFLTDADRSACSLVSRAWRYAGEKATLLLSDVLYLSAQVILQRSFSGTRLTEYLAPHRKYLSQLNMWPYLRYRQDERCARMEVYQNSFLHRLFGFCCVGDKVWSSGDDEREAATVLRFLMARMWLAVNVGDQRAAKWTKAKILGAKPSSLVSGIDVAYGNDVWKVSLLPGNQEFNAKSEGQIHAPSNASAVTDSVWIIAQTGEVIGHSAMDSNADNPGSNSSAFGNLRLDWFRLLSTPSALNLQTSETIMNESPSGNSTSGGPSLLKLIRWSNAEEYEYGISKHWLRRLTAQRDSVDAKWRKIVAERYILASVAGNCLSGCHQTPLETAQEFAGITSIVPNVFTRTGVSLYIPEHHFVESVHFDTPRGIPLHPALAVVQTTSREFYILKDTGSEIGTEEEGVKPVWMDAIGCAVDGIRSDCRA